MIVFREAWTCQSLRNLKDEVGMDMLVPGMDMAKLSLHWQMLSLH